MLRARATEKAKEERKAQKEASKATVTILRAEAAPVSSTAHCGAVLKSGKRKGQQCGADMPCKRHKVAHSRVPEHLHLNMTPYIPELWIPTYPKFNK